MAASGSAAVQAERPSGDDTCRTGWRSGRADAGAARRGSSPSSTAGCAPDPARATWAEHLDYLQALLARYVEGADEVVVALRGLERFTALEAEVDFDWFLDVVQRAIGTLRSEDVIDSRPGAFAARGRERRGRQFAGRDRVRARVDPRRDRAGVPAAGAPGPDPARRRARGRSRERAGTPLAPARCAGSEEALVFALACEAARERLVVSYARRATGESRPRLPSVFFRELASQLEGERVSAERRAAARRATTSSGSPATRSARRSARAHAHDPRAVSAAAASAVSEPERDRTYLQARVTRPLAVATFERAQPSFARALEAVARAFAERYSAWDGALGPDAHAAIAALMPAEAPLSPTSLESYASCPQRFMLERLLRVKAVEEPERSVRIDALSRGSVFHRIFERFYDEWNGQGPGAARRRGASSGCGRSPARSATRAAIAARPAIRRCGRPIGSS